MIQRQHNVSEPIPPFYIRTLVGLEISLNSAIAKEKEAKKKMNATNAKALTAMRQKVKKAVKEYEKEVKQYQTVWPNRHNLFLLLTPVQDPTAFEREYAAAVVPGAPTATGMPPVAGSDEEPINDFVPVGKGGKAMQFTSEGIFKNLQAVQEARGKKVGSSHTVHHFCTNRHPEY
jgi:translation initiation factor 3 subunit C